MAERSRSGGGDTRRAVMAQLLKRGPVTTVRLAEALGLSAAGVRRHVDILVQEGLAESCTPPAVAGEEAGRGRPAKYFRLTDAGRAEFGNTYESLALDALDLVASLGGPDAVSALAKARAETILAGVRGVGERADGVEAVEADPADVASVVNAVAEALERHGYAASVTQAGGGIQLCQHHCPVEAVAAKHPEICEAEHEAISRLVGSHVQPLALIADGHGICTTNIPLAGAASVAAKGREPIERSGAHDESTSRARS